MLANTILKKLNLKKKIGEKPTIIKIKPAKAMGLAENRTVSRKVSLLRRAVFSCMAYHVIVCGG